MMIHLIMNKYYSFFFFFKGEGEAQSLYVARVRIGTLSKGLSDVEMDALLSLHTDIKLNDTQSLHPRRSQIRNNKTIPTRESYQFS